MTSDSEKLPPPGDPRTPAPASGPATTAPSGSGDGKEELARRLARELGIAEEDLMSRIGMARPAPSASGTGGSGIAKPATPGEPGAAGPPVGSPPVAAPVSAPAAPAAAEGLRRGVVVRRIVVSVKPGESPPPHVEPVTHARSERPPRRDRKARLLRAGAPGASVIERVDEQERRRTASPVERAWMAVRRIPTWSFSVLVHLLILWLLMQVVVFTERRESPTFTVFLGEAGGWKKTEEKGVQGDKNEEPPKVDPVDPPKEEAAPTQQVDPAPEREPVIAHGPAQTSVEPSNGAPAAISGRGGASKGDLLQKYGGSEYSEQAVEAGLRWLVAHQELGGEWSAQKWDRRCPTKDRCGGVAEEEYTPGLTGLSLLCFLGAGHTHKDGEFSDTVRRAINYLRRLQTPEGLFDTPLRRNTYNHAVCTLAVSEAYAMTQNAELGRMASQGILYLAQAQQPGGGWDYTDFVTDRNDMSIAGWAIMAMKSAKLGGLPVPFETWDRARKALLKATTPDGRVRYADKAPHVGRMGDGLTAVGLLCRYYMGIDDSMVIDRAARHLVRNTPLWRKLKTSSTDSTFYYWYYGTLALFQRGGRDWETWNTAMRDMLIRNQRKDGHAAGSWDPDDAWIGPYAGRLYATTLNILNLEIYYRYLPIYVMDEQGDGTAAPARGPRETPDRSAVEELSGERPATADQLLADLQVRDQMTRWKAARKLADMGERRAIPILMEIIPGMDSTSRAMFLEVLARFLDPDTAAFFAEFLEDAVPRVRDAALTALKRLSGLATEGDVRRWLKEKGILRK